ncbi:MAG: hypothetical protein GTN99_06805, partial [Candidatus Dadabacteria bacterium]|nr:hypothetical protein [Candidatus Dadabacteria bacterium]
MTEDKFMNNKTYDLKIIGWLFEFARPYRLFMVISFILMIFAALLELAIPYLAKVAVDGYINPSWAKIYKTSQDKNIYHSTIAKFSGSVIELDEKSSLINLKNLSKAEQAALEKSETLSKSRFIVINPGQYGQSEKERLS